MTTYVETVPHDLVEQYKQKIETGKEIAKGKKIVFCGLARNCVNKIENNIHQLHELGKNFADYRIIILENNSDDGTKEKLLNCKDIILIGEDDEENFSQGFDESRIERLSRYRTEVQKYVKRLYSDYDYVLILDFDVQAWSVDGVLTSLSWYDNFDMMGSYSQIYHPQLGSHDGWVNHDRWAFKFHSWTEEFSENQRSDMTWFWYWRPPVGARPIRCLSAFGGLGIYRMQAYLSGKYASRHPFQTTEQITSEHNEFHRSMAEAGYDKIYLNPSQRCVIGP